MILFMDDNEDRIKKAISVLGEDTVITRTAQETIEALPKHSWELVMLDHDLGGEVFVNSDREDCGMEVVRWLDKHTVSIDRIVVHSWNVPAAERMVMALQKMGYNAQHKMFV